MDWKAINTYNSAQSSAFETVCVQLFSNWCSEEFDSQLTYFRAIDGAGGDGGVEAYAELADQSVIGLQAKWFPDTLGSSQITQIKKSIITALTVRPSIKRYIVAIPKKLTSIVKGRKTSEEDKWKKLLVSVHNAYPYLIVELWDDLRLTAELQKDGCIGIRRYWFENHNLTVENLQYEFSKSKKSWLALKYVPDLNTPGQISRKILSMVGDKDEREQIGKITSHAITLCENFIISCSEFEVSCLQLDQSLINRLSEACSNIEKLITQLNRILKWLELEFCDLVLEDKYFDFELFQLRQVLKDCSLRKEYYFKVQKILDSIDLVNSIPFLKLLRMVKYSSTVRNLVFLGEPGTGKTHGAGAITEKLWSESYHIPILMQSKGVPDASSWRSIISSAISLAPNWNEEELFQALTSLAVAQKKKVDKISGKYLPVPKVVIIVDGIDESLEQEQWYNRIQESEVIVEKYPLLRFCFLSRPYIFQNKEIQARIVNLNPQGDVPVYTLFDQYIAKYRIIIENSEWIKYQLRTPLALKLFCELNQGRTLINCGCDDVSLAYLLRKKISCIETEFCLANSNVTEPDQYILRSILELTECFKSNDKVEYSHLLSYLRDNLSITNDQSKQIISVLENYGIIKKFCIKNDGILSPKKYYYSPGIQGYFDYAVALTILDRYEHPRQINFSEFNTAMHNAFYILTIISAQKYGYLIADNDSLGTIINENFRRDLFFFGLRHLDESAAVLLRPRVVEIMQHSAIMLQELTNHVVLPLSRIKNHPFGVNILDQCLQSFDKPAMRDIVWSVPANLNYAYKTEWNVPEQLELNPDTYALLLSDDVILERV